MEARLERQQENLETLKLLDMWPSRDPANPNQKKSALAESAEELISFPVLVIVRVKDSVTD